MLHWGLDRGLYFAALIYIVISGFFFFLFFFFGWVQGYLEEPVFFPFFLSFFYLNIFAHALYMV